MISFKTRYLGIGLLFLTLATPSLALQPSLNFSPSSKTVEKNETFTIDILLDTAGYDVGGTGAKISYDPNKLSVTKIDSQPIFADYPALIIDDANGTLTISGISASLNDLYNGRDTFATIWFLAKNSGETTAGFNFQPGSTTDSNIAVTFGNGDILAAVNQLKITIQESSGQGGGGDSLASPSPEPSPIPDNNLNNLINRLFTSVGLPAPFANQTNSTTGRPETNLTADQPLTQQAPITDPDQTQPVNPKVPYVSPRAKPTLKEWITLPEVYLTITGISILAGSFWFWRFKLPHSI